MVPNCCFLALIKVLTLDITLHWVCVWISVCGFQNKSHPQPHHRRRCVKSHSERRQTGAELGVQRCQVVKAERLSVLHTVLGKSLMEQDAKCLVKRKTISAVIFLFFSFVTMKFDTKTPLGFFQCSLLRQCLEEPCIANYKNKPSGKSPGFLKGWDMLKQEFKTGSTFWNKYNVACLHRQKRGFAINQKCYIWLQCVQNSSKYLSRSLSMCPKYNILASSPSYVTGCMPSIFGLLPRGFTNLS